jgi:UDP-N-acetylmuramate: L-alanyl-gamma-D-glutamyl-meso-diaminopimelate ligase
LANNFTHMNLHFIAIGGSAMHNLAIALHKKGYTISGSDDEIFEPSKTRLAKYELLPGKMGWAPSKIHKKLDGVILGMHAKADNPELQKAKELKLPIYSYPEFLHQQSRNKTRIVIGGSHGKTTITSMILHVLQYHGIETDYMVGAQLEGFEVMVKLTDSAPYMVLEGDEYLSSPIDKRPKFLLYKPHIALISGIAWDHINVFPTFENYVDQFRSFIDAVEENGKLIYCSEDPHVKSLCEEKIREDVCRYPYNLPAHQLKNDKTFLLSKEVTYPLQVFGQHNLLNISGALSVCRQLGVTKSMFMEAIVSFKGASNRLQVLKKTDSTIVFKDFAHAPSKLEATTKAVKEQFANRKIVAFMELHTFSSLNKDFLSQYNGSMQFADQAFVFYDPHALSLKRLPNLEPNIIKDAFGGDNLTVINNSEVLKKIILNMETENRVFLFMSSGNFGEWILPKLQILWQNRITIVTHNSII